MVSKKDTRMNNEGPEARRLFTIKEIIYIIFLIVSTVAAAIGTGIFAKDVLTADAIKQINYNTTAVQMLSNDFDNYMNSTEKVSILKEKNTQMQINNLEKDVKEMKELQKRDSNKLDRILEKLN